MDRYEKVDAYTIRVIQEKASDVALVNLIKSRDQMFEDIKGLKARAKSLEVIIIEAKKLGITPKEVKPLSNDVLAEKLGEENKNG